VPASMMSRARAVASPGRRRPSGTSRFRPGYHRDQPHHLRQRICLLPRQHPRPRVPVDIFAYLGSLSSILYVYDRAAHSVLAFHATLVPSLACHSAENHHAPVVTRQVLCAAAYARKTRILADLTASSLDRCDGDLRAREAVKARC